MKYGCYTTLAHFYLQNKIIVLNYIDKNSQSILNLSILFFFLIFSIHNFFLQNFHHSHFFFVCELTRFMWIKFHIKWIPHINSYVKFGPCESCEFHYQRKNEWNLVTRNYELRKLKKKKWNRKLNLRLKFFFFWLNDLFGHLSYFFV